MAVGKGYLPALLDCAQALEQGLTGSERGGWLQEEGSQAAWK